MAKLGLASSSRVLTLSGFPPDLPANSGVHEATFFIGAPNGVKNVTDWPANPDGSPGGRSVSYSMLVTTDDRTYCCFLNIRPTDFMEGGHYGDRSVEQLLDTKLEQALDTGVSDVIDIVASSDYVDRNGNAKAGKNGPAYLAAGE